MKAWIYCVTSLFLISLAFGAIKMQDNESAMIEAQQAQSGY